MISGKFSVMQSADKVADEYLYERVFAGIKDEGLVMEAFPFLQPD